MELSLYFILVAGKPSGKRIPINKSDNCQDYRSWQVGYRGGKAICAVCSGR